MNPMHHQPGDALRSGPQLWLNRSSFGWTLATRHAPTGRRTGAGSLKQTPRLHPAGRTQRDETLRGHVPRWDRADALHQKAAPPIRWDRADHSLRYARVTPDVRVTHCARPQARAACPRRTWRPRNPGPLGWITRQKQLLKPDFRRIDDICLPSSTPGQTDFGHMTWTTHEAAPGSSQGKRKSHLAALMWPHSFAGKKHRCLLAEELDSQVI
jgi:hypothetical protein